MPLIAPLREIVSATASGLRGQAVMLIATVGLAAVAVGFLTTAGFVLLAAEIGIPAAAAAVSVLFALAALATYLVGRSIAARQSARVAEAKRRAEGELVLGDTLARAFLTAFALSRRL